MDTSVCRLALLLAFEAGRWRGQVDLEEHFDREQYSSALVEVLHARQTAMPIQAASTGRTVTVNLRSQEWRDGVEKSSKENLEKALELLKTILPKQEYLNFD